MNPLIDFSQLKVAFLVGTLGQGGAEQQLVYILRTLREQGALVRALCLTKGEYWETPLRDLGVPVTWVGQSASRLGRLRKIIAELQTDRPMILQSQHFYTNLYAALAARALGIREIGAMRCDGASEVAEHGRALGWLSLHLPRRLAVNSQGAILFAEQHGVSSDRLFLLPNVIDHRRFQTPPRDGSPVVRLLTAGRLEPQKRMDRFLRMLAQLKTSATQPFKAVIAGDGALRSSLQEQAAALNLSPDIVEFRGRVNDMVSLYRETDVFVLTSDFEGTPNVVMEAMAAGLPVVATNVGGASDLIEHGKSGFLIAPNDEASLTETVRQLCSAPELRTRLGEAARQRIETRFALAQLPNFLSDLYRLALA